MAQKVRARGPCTKRRFPMLAMPYGNASSCSRAPGDACSAAVAQRLDEGALGCCRVPAIRPEQIYRAAHALGALDPELDQFAALQLVGAHHPRHEPDPQPRLDGALDRLVRVEFPALRWPITDPGQLTVRDRPRARAALAHEQGLAREVVEADPPAPNLQPAGPRDADELVIEEGLRSNAIRQVHLTGEPERHVASCDLVGHRRARTDHNLDVDVRMSIGEALKDRWQHVAARRRRSGEGQRSSLGTPQRTQIVLHPLERVEHPRAVARHYLAGVREPARPSVSLDQLLPDGSLERLQVLGGRRLTHPARIRRRRDRSAPAELDEQPEPRRFERINYAGRERHLYEGCTRSITRIELRHTLERRNLDARQPDDAGLLLVGQRAPGGFPRRAVIDRR